MPSWYIILAIVIAILGLVILILSAVGGEAQ